MRNIYRNPLVQYQYDALDRLVSLKPAGQLRHDRFYQRDRLSTEIQGQLLCQFFQGGDVLLAESYLEKTQRISLLITDRQGSVLRALDEISSYTPYGHHPTASGLTSRKGFNGERSDPITGHYLLGNGHRAFNPVLMRFNSPDSLSPFEKGGLNCYAYCAGDPVNHKDPTGKWQVHAWFANALLEIVGTYAAPYIPKRLVTWIPGVANPTFGKWAKRASKATNVIASASYVALNRYEAYAMAEPMYGNLLKGHIALATLATASAAVSTLHKIAIKGRGTPTLVRYRPNARTSSMSDTISTISVENGSGRFTTPTTSNTPPESRNQSTTAADIRNTR
jgi:RHS repeat-associated protein